MYNLLAFVKHTKQLEKFSFKIGVNKLGRRCFKHLIELSEHMENLKSLGLSFKNNQIQNDSYKWLGIFLQKLEKVHDLHLNIQYNGLTDEGIQELFT